MRAIKFSTIITGIRAKADRSLGLSMSTPELSSEQKVVILDLQGRNLDALLVPADEPMAEVEQVDKDVQHKSPSQRARSVLYVLWSKLGLINISFEQFYVSRYENFIESVKREIDSL